MEELRKQSLLTSGKVEDETEDKYLEARKKYQNTVERILMY